MPLYTKESLDSLKQRIDLLEVLSAHVDLKRSGSTYKALCPFHDEKTPSFHIQKGDSHYHCFGCGVHGDAIHFLMGYLKMTFTEAVESLAERFHVHLEKVEGGGEWKGPNKALLREALEQANRFFQFYLLHTEEGHEALSYLYSRGIDLSFIRQFQVGLAPKAPAVFRKFMEEKNIRTDVMESCGLLAERESGGYRDFFYDRITFPIHHASGGVIGFSARKYKEDTFGGKYVNTPETPLFKKSRVLFGIHHSRKRIAKERRVIVVEGQIDALKLIHEGFNFTVAGQGTAFGAEHVQELLKLGVHFAYLALDADDAGREAAVKVGDLFQKEGVEVRVVTLPYGSDPDSFLRQYGPDAFLQQLQNGQEYLDFLVAYYGENINLNTPAGKNECVQVLAKQIRSWNHQLMVHESLRKLAHLLQVPEEIVGVGQEFIPNIHIRKSASAGLKKVDPDRILECDFLRWLLLLGTQNARMIRTAEANVQPDDLVNQSCKRIYASYLERFHSGQPCDLLSLIEDDEDQLLITEMMDKKVNREKAEESYSASIQKILDRNWMEKREKIRTRIQSGQCSDEEAMELLKEFDRLKKQQPKVHISAAGSAPSQKVDPNTGELIEC